MDAGRYSRRVIFFVHLHVIFLSFLKFILKENHMVHLHYVLLKNGFKESKKVRAERYDECGKLLEERAAYEKHLPKCDLWVIPFTRDLQVMAVRPVEDADSPELVEILYQEKFPYDGSMSRYMKKINEVYVDEIEELDAGAVELLNANAVARQLEQIGNDFSGQVVITVKDGEGVAITSLKGSTAGIGGNENLRADNAPELVDSVEAARLLGISLGTLQNWRNKKPAGGPPSLKMGRSIRYKRKDIETWLDERYS
jgi:predicted DNA-binding transcriptional regulator AlpA